MQTKIQIVPGMCSKLHRSVSIFVPAYNEVDGLESALRGIMKAAIAELEDWEIFVVDDGSTDGTAELADRLQELNERIHVIHHPRNLGLGAAYESALKRATLDYFVFLPGDNEVDPVTFVNIFQKVGTADVLVPYHHNTWVRPWYRRVMTFACTTMLNVLLGNRLKYYQGPNVYPTELARVLPRDTSGGFFFLTEMLAYAYRLGFSVVHVQLIHREHWSGQSKALSLKNCLHAFRTIVRIWWELRVKGETGATRGQESSLSDSVGGV
jgi:glycosyltransferase involved in cell wall biosynthesis